MGIATPAQEFKIGDHLQIRNSGIKENCPEPLIQIEADGIVDQIEWSMTFKTWCYRLSGKQPFWVYENDRRLRKVGTKRRATNPARAL